MYSKKQLLSELAKQPGADCNWALFPMSLPNGETLAIWAVPEKLKLLRLLALAFALHKSKNGPALYRARVNGILIEKTSEKWIEKFYDRDLLSPNPIAHKKLCKTDVLVNLEECIIANNPYSVCRKINLQHFIDEIGGFGHCPLMVRFDYAEVFKNICDYYCRAKEGSDTYVVEDASGFNIKYINILDIDYLEYFIGNSGIYLNSNKFDLNHLTLNAELVVSLDFIQVEPQHAIAFIKIGLNIGENNLELHRSFHEFNSENALSVYVENCLRQIFHGNGKERLIQPAASSDLLEAIKYDPDYTALTPVDQAFADVFISLQHDEKRNAERWKNIMEKYGSRL